MVRHQVIVLFAVVDCGMNGSDDLDGCCMKPDKITESIYDARVEDAEAIIRVCVESDNMRCKLCGATKILFIDGSWVCDACMVGGINPDVKEG